MLQYNHISIPYTQDPQKPLLSDFPKDHGWGYMIPLDIYNPGQPLTDYQVRFDLYRSSGVSSGTTLYLGANCMSDFRDVRFSVSTPVTPFPQWFESMTSTSATIWVKVPYIPTGSSMIYLYYGNPSAIPLSNGDATFMFFDDFNGSSLDTTKWTAVSGTWAVSNGICTNVASGNTRGVLNATGAPTADNYIMRAKYRTTSQDNDMFAISVKQANSNPSYAYSAACRVYSGNTIAWLEQMVSWGTQIDSLTWADDIWMTNEIVHDGTNVKFRKNDGTWYNWTKSGRSGYLGFQNARSSSGTQTMEIDWALVRKYSAIEPTVSPGTPIVL